MFFLTDNIKQKLQRLALGLVAAAAIAIAPTAASAAGEQYQWGDSDYQSIAVSGGHDAAGTQTNASGTLQQVSGSGNSNHTFTGPITFNCPGGAQTATVSVTVSGTSYADGKPNPYTTGTVANRTAACVTLDSPLSISQVAGGTDPAAQAPTGGTSSDEPDCDQGSVSWMLCPFISNASQAISKVGTTIIAPFLRVAPLEKYGDDGAVTSLYQAWSGFRNLAFSLFIIVFIVIIYATLTQQDVPFLDSYTIKKILPRLVFASILVQASFLISGLFIDLGNVGGVGIAELLNSITNPHDPVNIGHVITNLIGSTGIMIVTFGTILNTSAWIALAPLLLSLLLSVLVVVLVLGLRYLLIAVLIVVSPLAMLAWVLPNTRKWFGNWMELFLRLVLMYPVIIGVISLAGIGNSILPSTGDVADNQFAGIVTGIIRPIIVIAAFLVIPFTFKLAGRSINRAYAIFNGQAQRGRSMLKSSDFWDRGKKERQRRKNNAMGSVLNSSAITKLQSGGRGKRALAGMAGLAASGALLGAPASRRTLQASNNKLVNDDKKQLGDLAEAGNPGNLKAILSAYAQTDPAERAKKLEEQRRINPELVRIASNHTGRRAIVNKLSDMGALGAGDVNNLIDAAKLDNVFSVSRDVAAEYPSLMAETGKEGSAKPFVVRRITKADPAYKVKDAAGNVIKQTLPSGEVVEMTIEREVGDLDQNAIATALRTVSGRDLGDKFGTDNFDVWLQAQKPGATDLQKRVAVEAAQLTSANLPIDSIERAMSTVGRSQAPLKNRLTMSLAFQSQRAEFAKDTQGQRKYEAIVANLTRDEDLSREIARQAGTPEDTLKNASVETLGAIAQDWMRENKQYDEYHVYSRNGAPDPKTSQYINYKAPEYK